MPFRRQSSVSRDGSAAAEGRPSVVCACGTPEITFGETASYAVPLVDFPTLWAAWALQPDPLAVGARVVGRQLGAVLGGVPPGDNAWVVSQGRSFAARSYRRSV